MSCQDWQDPIALAAGGNLSALELETLERHLQDCPACRRFADEMAASQQALQRYAERPLEEAGLARIRAGVARRLEPLPTPRAARRGLGNHARWLALAASLVAAVALWQTSFRPGEIPSGETRPAVEPTPPAPSPAPPHSFVPTPAPPVPAPPSQSADVLPPVAVLAEPAPPREARAFGRPDLVDLSRSKAPLDDSSWVALPASSQRLAASASHIALPAAGESPRSSASHRVFELPSSGPTLRRLVERDEYTIYWLSDEPDGRQENEHADT